MLHKKNKLGLLIIVTLLSILIIISNDLVLYKLLALLISVLSFYRLIYLSIRELAIFEIIFFVCILQMVVFPLLNPESIINLKQYLFITIIGIIFFYIGCNLGRNKIKFNRNNINKFFRNKLNLITTKVIILLGLIGLIINLVTKDALLSLLYNFTNIGIVFSIGLIYVNWKRYWIYITLYFIVILVGAIRSTVFASVISFSILVFVFLPYLLKFSKKKLIITMIFGFFLISIFQNVKTNYRSLVWIGEKRDYSFSLFVDALFSSSKNDSMSFNERANAGNTISMIYAYIPEKYPFTYGEQLLSDLSNGLLPRVLFPNKKDVDTRGSYIRYTGEYLQEEVSVGINVFGISYAEFGIVGSWIFLFLFGRILCLFNNWFIKRYINEFMTKKNVMALLIFPIIFSGFIKFEEEFVGQIVGWIRNILIIIIFLESLKFLKLKQDV